MNETFKYPLAPIVRRHGPRGYSAYSSYRPWLRDEFSFRCVYCLMRETWVVARGKFAVDHFVPMVIQPKKAAEYKNLVYACTTCNLSKGKRRIPDPCVVLVHDNIRVSEDGSITPSSKHARRLVRALGLDSPEYNEFRRLWIDIISLAMKKDSNLYRRLMGFPNTLPDLKRQRPPGGNALPAGIRESFHSVWERGELPATY